MDENQLELFSRADALLAALANDPDRLNRERRRFDDDAPPPYRQRPSLPSTASQPSPPNENQSEEQKRLVEWYFRIRVSQHNSLPDQQFNSQVIEEQKRFNQQGSYLPQRETVKIVEKRWQAQGIWNKHWRRYVEGWWQHEHPLDPERLSDAESDDENVLFGKVRQPRPIRSAEEQRQAEERRQARYAERVRQNDLSRPFYQFVAQVSDERGRLVAEHEKNHADAEEPVAVPPDINTAAYEKVKERWTNSGIWYAGWGIMPGMKWKHEYNLSVILLAEMGPENVAKLGDREDIPAERIRALPPLPPPRPPTPPPIIPAVPLHRRFVAPFGWGAPIAGPASGSFLSGDVNSLVGGPVEPQREENHDSVANGNVQNDNGSDDNDNLVVRDEHAEPGVAGLENGGNNVPSPIPEVAAEAGPMARQPARRRGRQSGVAKPQRKTPRAAQKGRNGRRQSNSAAVAQAEQELEQQQAEAGPAGPAEPAGQDMHTKDADEEQLGQPAGRQDDEQQNSAPATPAKASPEAPRRRSGRLMTRAASTPAESPVAAASKPRGVTKKKKAPAAGGGRKTRARG